MMRNVAIIGAGPAGLYAAIQLKKAGVENVTVIDPRLGEYSRPGHINAEVFNTVYEGLGLNRKTSDFGHIKDIERFLYQHAQNHDIHFVKQSFVSLNQEGVLLSNSDERSFIPCDHVFDCSGGKRVVANAVNQDSLTPPFEFHPVTDVQAQKHLIAYVRLNSEAINRLNFTNRQVKASAENEDLDSLRKLQTLGWKKAISPNCYATDFGKGKACIYTEMPDNCEDQMQWLQTVLVHSTKNPDIFFEQLPASQKPYKKPRMMSFSIMPSQANKLHHACENLPAVTLLGDAIVNPDYRLAHGITTGVKITNCLIQSLVVNGKGAVTGINASQFESLAEEVISEHCSALKKLHTNIKKRSIKGMVFAYQNYHKNPSSPNLPSSTVQSTKQHLFAELQSIKFQQTSLFSSLANSINNTSQKDITFEDLNACIFQGKTILECFSQFDPEIVNTVQQHFSTLLNQQTQYISYCIEAGEFAQLRHQVSVNLEFVRSIESIYFNNDNPVGNDAVINYIKHRISILNYHCDLLSNNHLSKTTGLTLIEELHTIKNHAFSLLGKEYDSIAVDNLIGKVQQRLEQESQHIQQNPVLLENTDVRVMMADFIDQLRQLMNTPSPDTDNKEIILKLLETTAPSIMEKADNQTLQEFETKYGDFLEAVGNYCEERIGTSYS